MLKHIKYALSGLCLFTSALASAQGGVNTAEVSPASGVLLATQKFDISIYLPGASIPKDYKADYLASTLFLSISIDGVDKTSVLRNCFVPMKRKIDESLSLVCANQTGSLFGGEGLHTLDVTVVPFKNDQTFKSHTEYKVINAYKFISLPTKVNVPATSPITATGIYLNIGDSVNLLASGYATIWPGPTGFPLNGPKGGSSYCVTNSICLLSNAPVGALLYKVGLTGPWKLYTADNMPISITQPGELFFSINDKAPSEYWLDNVGSFDVTLSGYLSNKTPTF